MDPALEWLLDPAEPAVRAQALVDLAGRERDDPDVQAARKDIAERGSAARLLAGLAVPDDPRALYVPKYGAPFHRVVALAEMGVTVDTPRAAAALERLLDAFAHPDGGFGGPRGAHLCITGNLTRAAFLMGRGDDPRVHAACDWLVNAQRPDGGWHCHPDEGGGAGTLDAWEALAAFAAVPAAARRAAVRDAIARGVAFLLDRGLGLDDAYAPWQRLHFPRHYYYDLLVGLDLVTALGDPRDPRLAPALDALMARRGADGRWRLDAQHPDLGPGTDYTPHDPDHTEPVTPLVAEEAGAPSRWVTLGARRVLRRAGRDTVLEP